MSEQNTALIEEVGKLLGDSHAGKLAKSVAGLLRLERANAEQAERERIIELLDTLKCGCDEECDIVEISFRNLITLIKEENSER